MNTRSHSSEPTIATRYLIWDICFSAVLIAALCAVSYEFSDRAPGAVVSPLIPISGLLLLSLLERFFPLAGPSKSTRRWWLHLQITVANAACGILIGAFLGAYVSSALSSVLLTRWGIEPGFIDLTVDPANGLVGFVSITVLGFIITDLFFYWFHRAMHKSPVMWQIHKMHHMDPEFDAMTALRTNWLEHVVAAFLISLPSTVLFKLPGDTFIEVGLINGLILYVLFLARAINHSNLRIQFGRASFIWVSTQTHRIHHSRLPEHRDKNFAAWFPLWDVLFGTYYAPKWDEFPPTGVDGEREIKSFWEAQIFTFREWWRMSRS